MLFIADLLSMSGHGLADDRERVLVGADMSACHFHADEFEVLSLDQLAHGRIHADEHASVGKRRELD